MRLIDVAPDCRLAVHEPGTRDGMPLVLLHALGTDSTLWQPQHALTDHGYRLIGIDAPGHGASPQWDTVRLDDLAAAVWRVADACLNTSSATVTIAGTSMGAVIALRAAALAPARVRRLILCGALLQRAGAQSQELGRRLATAGGDLESVATTMVDRWFGHVDTLADPVRRATVEDLRARLRAMVRATSPAGYAACAAALAHYDLLPELRALQGRTVLFTGAHDPGVPEHFATLHAACPQTRLVVLPDVGHFPALEAPEAFAAQLTA